MPLLGGLMIGVAVSLMLFLNGRITGVSGIVSGMITGASSKPRGDFLWRLLFCLGLVLGGSVLVQVFPESIPSHIDRDVSILIIAGLLVGFGTVMGSGCTSGHGICGLSRFSPRSLISTLTFMGFGVLSATLFRVFFLGVVQ